MNDRIKPGTVETLSNGFINLTRHTIDYQRTDGTWQTLVREIHDHGNAAAILPVDWRRRTVLLVRQFRLPVHLSGEDGFLIEAIAGLLDGDAPEICAAREAEEEAGVNVSNITHAFTAFTSPGCITERTDFFLAEYDGAEARGTGGGLAHEGEDIEVLELSLDDVLKMIGTGAIRDIKAILLVQHAALLRTARAT